MFKELENLSLLDNHKNKIGLYKLSEIFQKICQKIVYLFVTQDL